MIIVYGFFREVFSLALGGERYGKQKRRSGVQASAGGEGRGISGIKLPRIKDPPDGDTEFGCT